ncbi:MAG: type I-F CRISPR-associated helicase Cas3f, partial [Pseudomonadales bacterium]|nr:type I-F CRISPR-associated helicase Cas3f [Pseudomonadales bacterium]
DGYLTDGPLSQWLENRPKLQKLLHAPILVSTIDHLIPATEAQRGGKQISPMLRLLTSDLILDEPDDFDAEDIWALSRLVNWAGMLGARVLLSSATLPPDTVHALYDSYREGRQHYNRARGKLNPEICCAWFDEFHSVSESVASLEAFKPYHQKFVAKRAIELKKASVTQRARIVDIPITSTVPRDIISSMGNTVLDSIYQLHDSHKETIPSGAKSVSLGLIRMANINPLVALAKYISRLPARDNYQLHLCVYHGQQPLIVRSAMETVLDRVFDRHNAEQIWMQPEIQEALSNSDAQHHIFIVLGTSVTEVGRDWDASWGIAEPSSMRSIIQFAGRINRHRRIAITEANLILLNTNFRALNVPGKAAFCRPGFETEKLKLKEHDLNTILTPEQYEVIRAIPRIEKNAELDASNRLVDLEHQRLNQVLFQQGNFIGANIWWDKACHHTYLLQDKSRFRSSAPATDYFLNIEADGELPVFHAWHDSGEHKSAAPVFAMDFDMDTSRFDIGVSVWATIKYAGLIEKRDKHDPIMQRCMTYGALSLRDLKSVEPWHYSEIFGVYRSL